jgi:hypothetical protein
MRPTGWLWSAEPVPAQEDVEDGYFDYNPSSPYGPAHWDKVRGLRTTEGQYWKRFQDILTVDLDDNVCGSGSRRQSPIDLRFADSRGQCFEYHEIRHRDGEFSVADPIVEASILPTRLRIVYPYEVIDDVDEVNEENAFWTNVGFEEDKEKLKDGVKGPSADIPKGWGYQLPVTHVDIKVPSEHWMEGRQYAAEYQINLIQNRSRSRGAPVISILIDEDDNDVDNRALQVVLDRFQKEYDADMAVCESRKRDLRRLDALLTADLDEVKERRREQSTWLDEPEEEQERFRSHLRRTQAAVQPKQAGYTLQPMEQ